MRPIFCKLVIHRLLCVFAHAWLRWQSWTRFSQRCERLPSVGVQEMHGNGDRTREFPSTGTSVVNGSHRSRTMSLAPSGVDDFRPLEQTRPASRSSQLRRGRSFVSRFSVSGQSADSASETRSVAESRGRSQVRTTRAARLRSESARRKRAQLEEDEARRKDEQADPRRFNLEKGFPLTPRDRGISSDRLRPVDFPPPAPPVASGGPATPTRKLRLPEDELLQSGERQYLVAQQYERRREQKRQLAASQYTFSPSITRRAQSAGCRCRARFEKLYASADVTRMRRLAAAADPELTFQPTITDRARRLRRRPSETFDLLYNTAQLTAERRAAKQMAMTASLTFAPRVLSTSRRKRSSSASPPPARLSGSSSPRVGASGIGTSLYERARQSQQRKEILRQQKEEIEARQYSFRPQINSHRTTKRRQEGRTGEGAAASHRGPPRARSQSVDATVHRLLQYGKVTESRRAMLQKAKETQGQQAVTGRPSIPARSRELAEKRRAERGGGNPRPTAERLHAEYKTRLLQLAEKRRELQAERKSWFKPRVGHRSRAIAKRRSLSQTRSPSQRGTAEASATSHTEERESDASRVRESTESIFERLHKEAAAMREEREKLHEAAVEEEVEQYPFRPFSDRHSVEHRDGGEGIWERLHQEAAEKAQERELQSEQRRMWEAQRHPFQPSLRNSFSETVRSDDKRYESAGVSPEQPGAIYESLYRRNLRKDDVHKTPSKSPHPRQGRSNPVASPVRHGVSPARHEKEVKQRARLQALKEERNRGLFRQFMRTRRGHRLRNASDDAEGELPWHERLHQHSVAAEGPHAEGARSSRDGLLHLRSPMRAVSARAPKGQEASPPPQPPPDNDGTIEADDHGEPRAVEEPQEDDHVEEDVGHSAGQEEELGHSAGQEEEPAGGMVSRAVSVDSVGGADVGEPEPQAEVSDEPEQRGDTAQDGLAQLESDNWKPKDTPEDNDEFDDIF